MHRFLLTCALLCTLVAGAHRAEAALLDSNGTIVDWGFKPFGTSHGNWSNDGFAGNETGMTTTEVWSEGNNVAPVNYPNNIGYIPSPDATNGEKFDLEFLGWKVADANTVKILGITSVNPNSGVSYGGRTYHLGDVFINGLDGDSTADMALTAGQWTTNLADRLGSYNGGYAHEGEIGLYGIDNADDLHGITTTANLGYGGNPVVSAATEPFSITGSARLLAGITSDQGDIQFEAQSWNYDLYDGRSENLTWVMQWTIDRSLLPTDLSNLTMHWTVECGNDVISTLGGFEEPQPPVVPEPATLSLVGLGLISTALARRRRRA